MASRSVIFLLLLLALGTLGVLDFQKCYAKTFSFDIHHRFSDPVNGGVVPQDWPKMGTVDYYAALAHRDRTFRGRGLADDPDRTFTFSDGNETVKLASLGFLHYTVVSLGTPNVTFLVALDTGSDVFWVPCDCISCAPTSSSRYQYNLKFSIYSPNSSTTSSRVSCNNSLCEEKSKCVDSQGCPYKVAYVSADTSSSGFLVEDVMYLMSEDGKHDIVAAPITFGCGQVQTGSFLDAAAPNGLFGLGMEKKSVPSILSAAGLTPNSFSMCFGRDGIGRITFGDKGSPDQNETPFNLKQSRPTYNVTVAGVRVGASLIDTSFSAIIDSGTSFTYLADPAYTLLSESFQSQAFDTRRASDERIPFEYCYFMSSNQNASLIPRVSFTMNGGAEYSVYDPIIVIAIQSELLYCLAIVKSRDISIIGQNFMTGNRIVFDREKMVLGWKQSDCYSSENSSSTLPINPHKNTTAQPPSVTVGPGKYSPEATKETGSRGTQGSVIPPVNHSPPLSISCLRQAKIFLMLCICYLAIL
ncbi:aspartyl protease family protein 1-like [Aristolochia californica]|uniref:aspartyl protease family protein 1-like n=1 Tax=Aristolochia californica TaxID=171875 RepID=UPI0035DF8B22